MSTEGAFVSWMKHPLENRVLRRAMLEEAKPWIHPPIRCRYESPTVHGSIKQGNKKDERRETVARDASSPRPLPVNQWGGDSQPHLRFVAHPDRQQLVHFSNMFSLQEMLNSQMLSSLIQPSISAPQQSFAMPLNTQLYVLMNAHLQNMLNTMPHGEKVKEEPEEGQKTQCSFSIDNLLRPESEEKQTSHTPDSDLTTYTLDALEVSDGRTKSSKKLSNMRYICDQCGKSYATTSNLSRHKQTHRPLDSEHAKQCPHCDRVYVSMPALSMHILTHKASHKCDICGKVFSRLWLLQGHLRSHTGQRPFGCAHCGKSFADRSNLRMHILTHTGEKKYSCKNCGRRFALRSYLKRHLETSCRSDESCSPCETSGSALCHAVQHEVCTKVTNQLFQ